MKILSRFKYIIILVATLIACNKKGSDNSLLMLGLLGAGSGGSNPAPGVPAIAFPARSYSFVKDSAIPTTTPIHFGSAPTGCVASPALPEGLSIDSATCTISGTPTTIQSAASYTITATNGNGSGSDTITIAIGPGGGNSAAPAITFPARSYSFIRDSAIPATAPTLFGSTPTSCTAINLISASPTLPAGLSIDSATCAISGTPTTGQSAMSYTITASNAYGSGSDTIIIEVQGIPGNLDRAFNTDGVAVHNSAAGGNGSDSGTSLAIQADGKIVVAGSSWNGTNYDMAIWRYNTNGTLDTTFNGVGYAVHNSAAGGNGDDSGTSVAVQADGKIVVTGYSWGGWSSSYRDMVIWRYNANGTLDTTFNGVGYAVHNNAAGGIVYDSGTSVAIQADGKIVVAGYSYGTNDDMVIWRYNANGTLDTTFNGVGYAVHDNAAGGNSQDHGASVAIQADGKIVVAGDSVNASFSMDMAIWRYNTNGTLDTTFNGVGYAVHHNAAGGNSNDFGNSAAIQADGKIVVAGASKNASPNYDLVIWRYNASGTLDTVAVHHNAGSGNGDDLGKSMVVQSDGKIVAAGYSWNGTSNDLAIWRYNANGTLDTTFDTDGVAVHYSASGGNGDDLGSSVAIQADGKIVVAGYSSNGTNFDMAIWRYWP